LFVSKGFLVRLLIFALKLKLVNLWRLDSGYLHREILGDEFGG